MNIIYRECFFKICNCLIWSEQTAPELSFIITSMAAIGLISNTVGSLENVSASHKAFRCTNVFEYLKYIFR